MSEKNQKSTKSTKILRSNRSKKKSFQIQAEKRIRELFDQANKFLSVKQEYADNCVKLARKIALKYKVSFSKEQKQQYCKNCGTYLTPAKTSRIRVSDGKIKILCLNCKHISRYKYK
ncbi:ribonuclease P [Candidatus Woesearchaeota archaeon]|nr:ribonuclease P [Candidatus Woesearchaeota archaeon]